MENKLQVILDNIHKFTTSQDGNRRSFQLDSKRIDIYRNSQFLEASLLIDDVSIDIGLFQKEFDNLLDQAYMSKRKELLDSIQNIFDEKV